MARDTPQKEGSPENNATTTNAGHDTMLALMAKNLTAKEKVLKKQLKSTRIKRNALEEMIAQFEAMKADLFAEHVLKFGVGAAVPPPANMMQNRDNEVSKNKPKEEEEAKGEEQGEGSPVKSDAGMPVGDNQGDT